LAAISPVRDSGDAPSRFRTPEPLDEAAGRRHGYQRVLIAMRHEERRRVRPVVGHG
jgi:hypothetical protein